MHDCCPSDGLSYDLIVVGAGSAGFSAAITAAEAGARVLIAGHGTIGGTCVNTGCVPSKNLIRAAEAVHGAGAADRFPGLAGRVHLTDWHALKASKDALVGDLREKKYLDLLPQYDNVTYVEGKASLIEGGIRVDDQIYRAVRTLIATGASPVFPDMPGIAQVSVLTSTEALDLDALPSSLLVLGGGYIGCELAQMFSRLGSAVTLVTRSRLLPYAEPEISERLAGVFLAEGIKVVTGVTYRSVTSTPDGVRLDVACGGLRSLLDARHLLVTAGRKPNSDGLGLGAVGVERDERGGIVVDETMRTANPSVYAAGDVTGRDQFVYMAAYGAKIAARNALGINTSHYDNAAMPWVVFSDPQIAGVGLSEREAKAKGLEVKTSVAPLDQVPRALAARDTRGLIKLVADAGTDRLLGAQIMAPEGADSIQTMALALKFGMTARELGETIFPYLTTVEGLKLAAQGFDKDVAKLSCCAG